MVFTSADASQSGPNASIAGRCTAQALPTVHTTDGPLKRLISAGCTTRMERNQ